MEESTLSGFLQLAKSVNKKGKSPQDDEKENGVETCECSLISWGEIYTKFLGDREHSLEARHILREPPFRLFSSSEPWEPIPQELSLSFSVPYQVKKATDHGSLAGEFPEEIAKDFTAFLSLVTRRRVFATALTRYGDYPIVRKIEMERGVAYQPHQEAKEIDPVRIYKLLGNIGQLGPDLVDIFLLSMRIYHSAIELMFFSPNLSYLRLLIALETMSQTVEKDYRPLDTDDYLDSHFKGWRCFGKVMELSMQDRFKHFLLKREKYSIQKLVKFVEDNLPDEYWDAKEDDDRPISLQSMTGTQEPAPNRELSNYDCYERIPHNGIENTMRAIYRARAGFMHGGKFFPSFITFGLSPWVRPEAFIDMIEQQIAKIGPTSGPLWKGSSVLNPMGKITTLLGFERLVSYCLVSFLAKRCHGSTKDV